MRCSPCPSRGQQQAVRASVTISEVDAARAPHGDNNSCPGRISRAAGEMQPVPLTGTATVVYASNIFCDIRCSPYPSRGQQPRLVLPYPCLRSDAARTPHGDNNRSNSLWILSSQGDAARTPHGDSNRCGGVATRSRWMQPVPLTGTTTFWSQPCLPCPG